MDLKNSCPRSQNRGRRWLGLTLMVLAMMLTILLPGCGSSGDGGGNPVAMAYQDVIFYFNNTDADAKISAKAVPDGTAAVRFTGSDDSRQVLYGPVSEPFANKITLTKVPVKTTGFVLEYLDSNFKLVGLYSVKPLNMSPYRATEVYINECPSISEILSSIEVVPDTITDLAVGYDETLTATAIFKDGQILDVSKYMAFTSSDEKVATVTGDIVTGVGGGAAVISGSLLGMASNDVNVTVNGGVVATSLTLSAEKMNVPAEHTRTLQAIVHFNNDTSKVISDGVWTVEPASGVVTLKTSGKVCEVTAVGAVGATAVVTATTADGALSASCEVTVIDGTLKSLVIERTDEPYEDLSENQIYSYGEGSTAQFKATATYTDGTEEDATAYVTWTSSNTTAAKFSETDPGLLQGLKENLTTNVTATLDDTTSDSIEMEVVYPGIVELQFTTEAERILIYKGGTYNVKVNAVYSNGKVKDVTTDPETQYDFCLTNGTVSTDYVTIVKDTENNVAAITGNQVTNGGYLRVTRTDAPSVTLTRNLVVVNDTYKAVTIKLSDNVGKTWSFDATSTMNEIRVPFGRKYTIAVEGETYSGVSGDITGNCTYYDSYPNEEHTAPKQDAPICLDGKNAEMGYQSKTSTISSYANEFNLDENSMDDTTKPQYRWDDESLTAKPTKFVEYKEEKNEEGEEEIVVEEHDFLYPNGENIIHVIDDQGEEVFVLKMIICRPAVDKYGFLGWYKNVSDKNIHRGSKFVPKFFAQKSNDASLNRVDIVEKRAAADGADDSHRIASEDMTVDVDIYNKISFMKKIEAAGDDMVCQDYTCKKAFGTTNDIKFYDSASEEDAGFGLTLMDGSWQSYNVDADMTVTLCPPAIKSYDIEVADLDGNVLTPNEKGEYVLEADSYFTYKLINAELSDNDPFTGDPKRTLVTRSRAEAMADDKGSHLVIEAMPEDTKPYQFHVLTTDIGYGSYAIVTPSKDLYCEGSAVKIVIRSKAKS